MKQGLFDLFLLPCLLDLLPSMCRLTAHLSKTNELIDIYRVFGKKMDKFSWIMTSMHRYAGSPLMEMLKESN